MPREYYDHLISFCCTHDESLGSKLPIDHTAMVLIRLDERTRSEVIKHFSCSIQLSMKFILLINVKMPTIVGILTFISRINDWLKRSTPENYFDFGYFIIYER